MFDFLIKKKNFISFHLTFQFHTFSLVPQWSIQMTVGKISKRSKTGLRAVAEYLIIFHKMVQKNTNEIFGQLNMSLIKWDTLGWGFPGASAYAGDAGSIFGSGRSPGGGNGNPLQYSCLENPMDGGTWRTTVHRVTKSQTWLNKTSA